MSTHRDVQPSGPPPTPAVRRSPAGTLSREAARGLQPIPAPRLPAEETALRPRIAEVPPAAQGPVLGERDLLLLGHLAEGRSTAEIAAAMAVTSNTTRTRIRRVQSKLGASHRDGLVEAARRTGVV